MCEQRRKTNASSQRVLRSPKTHPLEQIFKSNWWYEKQRKFKSGPIRKNIIFPHSTKERISWLHTITQKNKNGLGTGMMFIVNGTLPMIKRHQKSRTRNFTSSFQTLFLPITWGNSLGRCFKILNHFTRTCQDTYTSILYSTDPECAQTILPFNYTKSVERQKTLRKE